MAQLYMTRKNIPELCYDEVIVLSTRWMETRRLARAAQRRFSKRIVALLGQA
jgi:hypothetical protein